MIVNFKMRVGLKAEDRKRKGTHRNPLSPGLNPYWFVAVSWSISGWKHDRSTNIYEAIKIK
jgi:hypothetical protein